MKRTTATRMMGGNKDLEGPGSNGKRTDAETVTADKYDDNNREDNDEDNKAKDKAEDEDQHQCLNDPTPMEDSMASAGKATKGDHMATTQHHSTPNHCHEQLLVGWKWGTTGRGWLPQPRHLQLSTSTTAATPCRWPVD
jgi:hypothetical protein